MADVIEHGTGKLTEADIAAIVVYFARTAADRAQDHAGEAIVGEMAAAVDCNPPRLGLLSGRCSIVGRLGKASEEACVLRGPWRRLSSRSPWASSMWANRLRPRNGLGVFGSAAGGGRSPGGGAVGCRADPDRIAPSRGGLSRAIPSPPAAASRSSIRHRKTRRRGPPRRHPRDPTRAQPRWRPLTAPPSRSMLPRRYAIVRRKRRGSTSSPSIRPATFLVAGVAVPNAEVVVFDGKIELGRARADGRGEWIVLPDASIAPGHHELSLSSRDRADENAPEILSERTVVLIVPEAGKDIAGRPAQEGIGCARALGPAYWRRGQRGPAEAAPPSAGRSGWAGCLGAGGRYRRLRRTGLDRNPRPGGRGRAGPALCRRQARRACRSRRGRASGGSFRREPSSAGDHRLRVDQIDPKGAVVARVEFPLPGAGQFGELAQGRVAFVRPGNSLWRIARRVYGRGIRYTVIYGANRWQISDPDLIYPGQIFLLPKPPDRAG